MRNTKMKIAEELNFGNMDALNGNTKTAPAKCYMPPQWEDCIDSLNYLCQHKQVLMALIGVSGSGKTTFLQQFVTQARDAFKICSLEASSGLDTDELLTIIGADFKLSLDKSGNLNEGLEELLLSLQKQRQHFLLVIDNAHLLSNTNLQALDYLATHQPSARLHILVAGDLPLQTRLENLDMTGAKAQILALPSLNIEETEHYLQHNLINEGQQPISPFSTAEIARLNRLSGGIPGRLNRLAVRLIQKAQFAAAKQPAPIRNKTNKQVKLLGTLILLMGAGSIALWLGQQHTVPHNRPANITPAQNNTGVSSAASANAANAAPAALLSNSVAETYQQAGYASGQESSNSGQANSNNTALDGYNASGTAAGSAITNTSSQLGAQNSSVLATTATINNSVPAAAGTPLILSSAIANQTPSANSGIVSSLPLGSLASSAALTSHTSIPTVTGVNNPTAIPSSSFSTTNGTTPTAPQVASPTATNGSTTGSGQVGSSAPAGNSYAVSSPSSGSVAASSNKPANFTPANRPAVANSSARSSSTSSIGSAAGQSTFNGVANSTTPKSTSAVGSQSTGASTVLHKKPVLKSQAIKKPLSLAGHIQALLAAQPSHFSLQIMGSYNLSSITNLLKNSGLGKQAHYFHTLRQGKDWYVLVYGNFASRQAAQQAATQLPPSIRSLNPWPRDFGSIQAAIRTKPVGNAAT